MKDRITVDQHPCTKIEPDCAADQMAIYLDGDLLIGYASTVEGGCISLIVPFEEEDVPIIQAAVSELIGVSHGGVGMVPDVPDDMLGEQYDELDDEDETQLGSLEDEDSE